MAPHLMCGAILFGGVLAVGPDWLQCPPKRSGGI
jgi:hypothetical protein